MLQDGFLCGRYTMSFQLNLDSEKVGHAFPVTPLVVSPKTSIHDVFQLMREQNRGAVLICDGDKLVGIFTERDALRLMADLANLDVPIQQAMVPNPASLAPDATVGRAIKVMARGGYRQLPIVDTSGKPLGILKVSGILHYLVQHFPGMIYNLPPQPHHTTQTREGA